MQSLREVLKAADPSIASEVRRKVAELFSADSHLLKLGVNLAFAVRMLSDEQSTDNEHLFAKVFESPGMSPVVQRDIVLAMGKWGARYWLSDKKTDFESLHPWVRRAVLIVSYELGDEGKHWRTHVKASLSPFDEIVRQWVANKKAASQGAWEPPV